MVSCGFVRSNDPLFLLFWCFKPSLYPPSNDFSTCPHAVLAGPVGLYSTNYSKVDSYYPNMGGIPASE